jgi:hypothetical protein
MALTKTHNRMIADTPINVLDYGAFADGTNATATTAAINAALTAAEASGKPCYFPKGTYAVNAPIVRYAAVSIFGDGYGSVIDGSAVATGELILSLFGASSEADVGNVNMSFPIAANTSVITLTTTSGLSAEDMVIFRSTENLSSIVSGGLTYKKGEIGFVKSVDSGTQITLTAGLKEEYNSATIDVNRATYTEGVQVKNIRIVGGGAATKHNALAIRYARNPIIDTVYVEDCENTGLSFNYVDGGIQTNSYVKDCFGAVDGVGYAFGVDAFSQNCVVSNNRAEGVGCGFSTGGLYPAYNTVVSGNRFSKTTPASGRPIIQTHINGVKTVIDGNTVYDCQQGIGVFASNSIISNNQVSNATGNGIYLIEEGLVGATIIGNNVEFAVNSISTDSYTGSETASVLIIGNNIRNGAGGVGISCSSDNTRISNNHIHEGSPAILVQGSNSSVTNNTIVDVTSAGSAFGIQFNGTISKLKANNNLIYEENVNQLAFGFVVGASVTDCQLFGNDVSGYASGAISDGSGTVVAYDNILDGDRQIRNVFAAAGATNATTAGYAKTANNISYELNGRILLKNATDDLWDLTGVSTGAAEFLKVILCLNVSGVASIVVGNAATNQSLAKVPNFIPFNVCPVVIVEIPNSYSGGSLSGYVFRDIVGFYP